MAKKKNSGSVGIMIYRVECLNWIYERYCKRSSTASGRNHWHIIDIEKRRKSSKAETIDKGKLRSMGVGNHGTALGSTQAQFRLQHLNDLSHQSCWQTRCHLFLRRLLPSSCRTPEILISLSIVVRTLNW